jgi:hypothetical protein
VQRTQNRTMKLISFRGSELHGQIFNLDRLLDLDKVRAILIRRGNLTRRVYAGQTSRR